MTVQEYLLSQWSHQHHLTIICLLWKAGVLSTLISNDRHWNQCRNFDRLLSALGIYPRSPDINGVIGSAV